MYRRRDGGPEVLLVHPGGPYSAEKDDGAWGVPKGEHEAGEDPLDAARREFEEETGARPSGDFVRLGAFAQSKAKTVEVWAVEGDFDPGSTEEQPLFDAMATEVWPHGRVPGGGLGGGSGGRRRRARS